MTKCIIFSLMIFSFHSFANCRSDQQLKNVGFTVITDDFIDYFKAGESWLQDEEQEFVEDLSGTIYSSVASQLIMIKSFDHLSTPQSQMFGDLVLMRTFRRDRPIEIRWFDNGKKFVAYDKKLQPCATATIPLAENALF